MFHGQHFPRCGRYIHLVRYVQRFLQGVDGQVAQRRRCTAIVVTAIITDTAVIPMAEVTAADMAVMVTVATDTVQNRRKMHLITIIARTIKIDI